MKLFRWSSLFLVAYFCRGAVEGDGYVEVDTKDTEYFPAKIRRISGLDVRISDISESTNNLINRIRNEKMPLKILVNISSPTKILRQKGEKTSLRKRIEKIVQLRAICMLSNIAIVSSSSEKDILKNMCGVPDRKIFVSKKEEKILKKKTGSKLGKSIFLKRIFVPNGLYVLFAGASIHINAYIKNKNIESIFIRAVIEKPSLLPGEKILCRRGPYERRIEEEFAVVMKNSVFLSTTSTNIFKAEKSTLKIEMGGLIIRIDQKKMEVRIKTDQTMCRIGLVSKSKREKWRISDETNYFTVQHPRLQYRRDQMVSYLYNRPRRAPMEMFDPIRKKSPLKRVLISGWFNKSGMGDVSKRFLVEMAANQRLLIRSDSYNKAALRNMADPEAAIPQIYLFESGQTTKNRAIYPKGKYTSSGVEIRNSFPVNLQKTIPPYTKIFVHFPWEFSEIPSQWTTPIKGRSNMEIIVPSKFARNVHRNHKMDREKIHVVPHGVGFNSYRTMRNIEKRQKCLSVWNLFNVPKDYVRFVIVGGALTRKGIDTAINAYIRAFKSSDKVVLRIHTAYGDKEVQAALRNTVRKNAINKGPKIVFTENYIESKKIRALLALAHYNVSPYKGEGFGLSVLDGNALGSVPIVTNARPITEFCSKKGSFFIDCTLSKVQSYPVEVNRSGVYMFKYKMNKWPKWYEPSEDHLTRILKKAYKIAHTKKYAEMRRRSIESAKKHGWRKHLKKLERLILRK